MMWNASKTAGFYIVFRLQNPSNYLMVGIEQGGTKVGMYKIVNNVSTQLATADISMLGGVFYKCHLIAYATELRFYVNGILYTTSTNDPFNNSMTWVGIRMGGSNTEHYARNFVCTRLSGIGAS